MTKIIAKEALTYRDSSTGALMSIGYGQIANIDDTLAASLISDGLAEAYTLITPTGKKTITGTAEVDVANYATAQVVDENLIAGNIKKGVTILGVEGTYEA
jgi:hypothetical protein